jgi:putative methyltransferase (TIGR04325 family)
MYGLGSDPLQLLSQSWLALHRLKGGSALSALGELRQELSFARRPNAVRGRFASFEEAARAAPAGATLGYDSPAHAHMYDAWLGRLAMADYAALYWLSRVLPSVDRVFDLGGHKGLHYYGFKKRLALPETLSWLICDVPATVEAGRLLADERNEDRLEFTADFARADGADLLLASGVLQYLDWDLAPRLRQLSRLPRHLVVNACPIYDGESYVTLQNTWLSFNPYRVFNRAQLVGSLTALGYREVDGWRLERSLTVPLHPELHVEAYQGFYLELVPAT